MQQQLPMQQGQQQETKLLQGTRLVLPLPRAVTILQGQQADQQQVKVRAQAAALQAEEVIRSSTITTDREPLGLLIFLIFALCIG
jgi:hypothetical protein